MHLQVMQLFGGRILGLGDRCNWRRNPYRGACGRRD